MNRKFELVSGEGSGGNSYVSLDSDGTVRVNKNLDYEAFSNPVISIRVRCTDYTTESIKNCERQIGFTEEEVFKINVLDVLERPPEPPAPTQNQIYSAFGGGVTGKDWFVTIGSKTYGFPASMPLLLRVYGGRYTGKGWFSGYNPKFGQENKSLLKSNSNFRGRHTITMCSWQINVPAQNYADGFPQHKSLNTYFAAVWDGRIWCPKDGVYQFRVYSDDMSVVYINGKVVADDDRGWHPPGYGPSGSIHLKQGLNQIQVRFTQQPPNHLACVLEWAIPGGGWQVVPRTYFYPPTSVSSIDSIYER
jgi:hypothetical protein